jgi:hypothetical protein
MSNTYQIGLNMMWGSNWSQAFSSISSGLNNLDTKIGKLESQFGNLSKILSIGGAIYGGVRTFNALERIIAAGGAISTQQSKMRLAGDDHLRVLQDTNKAFAASARLKTISASSAMESMSRLRTMFGDGAGTDKLLDHMAKAQNILRAELGPDQGDQAWDLMQAARLRTSDPAEADRLISVMMGGIKASAGAMSGTAYQRVLLTARNAGLKLSDDFLGGVLPETATQFAAHGGASASMRLGMGQALGKAYTDMFAKGLPMGGEQARAAYQLDLVGRLQGKNDILRGADQFRDDPYQWVQKVLVPALAHNPKVDINNQAQVTKVITQIAGNPVLAQLMTAWALHGAAREGANSPYERAKRNRGSVMGDDAANAWLMDHDLATNIQAFNTQWQTLKEGFGSSLTKDAIWGLQVLTQDVLTPLGHFAQTNPTAFRILGESIMVAAAALMAAGIVAVIAALGPVGWIAGGIAVLGGALLTFTPVIKGFFDWLDKWLTALGLHAKNQKFTGAGNFWGNYDEYQEWLKNGTHPATGGGGGGARGADGTAAKPPWEQEGRFGAWGDASLQEQRARMKQEVANDPQLAATLRGVQQTEDAGRPDAVVESLANRTAYMSAVSGRNVSLREMIFGSPGHPSFYSTIRSGQAQRVGAGMGSGLAARLDAASAKVWGGSNVLKGATDQGMRTDPNGMWPGGMVHIPGTSESFNDWGGGGGHEVTRRWRENQQRMLAMPKSGGGLTAEQLLQHAAGMGHGEASPLRITIPRTPGKGSEAIPSPSGNDLHVNHTTALDGYLLAKNAIKHFVSMGNRRAGSGVMADYSGVRPLSV